MMDDIDFWEKAWGFFMSAPVTVLVIVLIGLILVWGRFEKSLNSLAPTQKRPQVGASKSWEISHEAATHGEWPHDLTAKSDNSRAFSPRLDRLWATRPPVIF
jgi:hypothetical protein